VVVIVAVGVNTDGRRQVLDMTVGYSKAEPFWVEFLRSLTRRCLRGVTLVVSDAHEGLKAAITKVLYATWQRCREHFMRNALAYTGKTQGASSRPRSPRRLPKMTPRRRTSNGGRSSTGSAHVSQACRTDDEAEADVLAYMDFPAAHRVKAKLPLGADLRSSRRVWVRRVFCLSEIRPGQYAIALQPLVRSLARSVFSCFRPQANITKVGFAVA
jgi:transposase-like protein